MCNSFTTVRQYTDTPQIGDRQHGARNRPRWRRDSATFPDTWLKTKGPAAWFGRLPNPNLDRACAIRVADIHQAIAIKPVAFVAGAHNSSAQLCFALRRLFYLLGTYQSYLIDSMNLRPACSPLFQRQHAWAGQNDDLTTQLANRSRQRAHILTKHGSFARSSDLISVSRPNIDSEETDVSAGHCGFPVIECAPQGSSNIS